MKMIRATTTGSYRKQKEQAGARGDHRHRYRRHSPDIAPNFNRALSRNFTVDIRSIRLTPLSRSMGCEDEPD
jgi:hypothetical protein